MKRPASIFTIALLCLAAVGYPFVRLAWERHTRERLRLTRLAESKPLVVDPMTRGILDGADRVETFRLADSDEEEQDTAEARAALSTPRTRFLDEYAVSHAGQPQDRAFAAALGAALARADSEQDGSQCFDPGVGFRVWKRQAHTDLCVCFYCAGVEIITTDARKKIVYRFRTSLQASRPAFLALSRQAFPQDKPLAALKND